MAHLEGWSLDKAQARCREVERIRDLFTRYFFGQTATQPAQYDLVVNTARVPLEDVTYGCYDGPVGRGGLGKGDSPHLPERPEGCSHKWGLSPSVAGC